MQLRVDSIVDANPWFDEIIVTSLIDILCIESDSELSLEVSIEDDLDGDRGGFCYAPKESCEHGAHGWLSISPKACEQDPEDILRTLCHELIHLEQYVEGRLVENYRDQTFTWFSRPWTFITYPMDHDGSVPWEEEAEKRGIQLYHSYF